jgi:hypothetical protein
MKIAAVILAGLIVVVILVVAANHTDPSEISNSRSPASEEPPSSTGNVAHDGLVQLDPSARAKMLGSIVVSSGDACTGEDSFFMGINRRNVQAFWSVRCTNGKSYEVAIDGNATGSTKVLDCDILKTVPKVSCFVKLNSSKDSHQ